MRKIKTEAVTEAVAKLCVKTNYDLRKDVEDALVASLGKEESSLGKEVLKVLIENACLAREEQSLICQDTGYVNVILEIGRGVEIVGGLLAKAINEGVRKGYSQGYLRNSMVKDPLYLRKNTDDNTPAVIHTEIVEGERLKIIVMPKGGGTENASALKMLSPADGKDGVKKFVLERVKEVGYETCPPLVVGVGIGGSFDSVSYLGKKALLRNLDEPSSNERLRVFENELLDEINNLGIGPAGLGGRITALRVSVETCPTHMATLPVAVNISCHALRSGEIIL